MASLKHLCCTLQVWRNRASNSGRVAPAEGAAMVDASFSLRAGAAEPRPDPRYPRPCRGCRRRSTSPTDQTGAFRLQSTASTGRMAIMRPHDTQLPPPLVGQTGDTSTGRVVERPVRVPTAGVSLTVILPFLLRIVAALCFSRTEVAAVATVHGIGVWRASFRRAAGQPATGPADASGGAGRLAYPRNCALTSAGSRKG